MNIKKDNIRHPTFVINNHPKPQLQKQLITKSTINTIIIIFQFTSLNILKQF